MKITDKLYDKKGSLTLQASLVFVVLILSVITIICICMLLYQKVYVQSVADLAIKAGAAAWNNSEKNMTLGRVSKKSLKEGGLYWRLFDAKSSGKKKILKQYIQNRLNAFNLFKPVNSINIEVKDGIFYKKLMISIKNTYDIPFGSLVRIFGINEKYTFEVKSEAVINEPIEFIRNTDFVLDIEKEFETKYPEYGEAVKRIRSMMSSLQEKISEFKFY